MTQDRLPGPQEVYARILRAIGRGAGITLTPDECTALIMDTAVIDAACGGDTDEEDPPHWLTPTERRRWLAAHETASGERFDESLFRPGRDVLRG